MRVAAEIYEAELMPRRRTRLETLTAWRQAHSRRPSVTIDLTTDGVVDIVVVDQRNGAEVVRLSAPAVEASALLSRVHRDLDSLSPASFDETWGLL